MNILYLKKKPFLVFLNYTLLPNFKFVALTSFEIISGQTKKQTKKNHCALIYKIYNHIVELIQIDWMLEIILAQSNNSLR